MEIKNYKLLSLLIVIILFSACNMQKRLYTKGFYAHKNKALKKPKGITNTDTLPTVTIPHSRTKKTELIANNSKKHNSKFLSLISPFTDACDTIILKSGAKLTVSIKDASSTEIKYRTCPISNGLYLSIKKSDISRINYGNGRKEVFEEEHKYNQPANLPEDKFTPYNTNNTRSNRSKSDEKKTNSFGIIGFVLGFIPLQIGLIFAILNLIGKITIGSGGASSVASIWYILPMIFAFISFIFCLIAVIQILKNKETQKGLAMAIFGLILSLILIIILLALTTF